MTGPGRMRADLKNAEIRSKFLQEMQPTWAIRLIGRSLIADSPRLLISAFRCSTPTDITTVNNNCIDYQTQQGADIPPPIYTGINHDRDRRSLRRALNCNLHSNMESCSRTPPTQDTLFFLRVPQRPARALRQKTILFTCQRINRWALCWSYRRPRPFKNVRMYTRCKTMRKKINKRSIERAGCKMFLLKAAKTETPLKFILLAPLTWKHFSL